MLRVGSPGASRVPAPTPSFGWLVGICTQVRFEVWALTSKVSSWCFGGRATPDPIPNSAVKSPSADGSLHGESRSAPA